MVICVLETENIHPKGHFNNPSLLDFRKNIKILGGNPYCFWVIFWVKNSKDLRLYRGDANMIFFKKLNSMSRVVKS